MDRKEKKPAFFPGVSRRRFLFSGAAMAAASAFQFSSPVAAEKFFPGNEIPDYDGSAEPYPIPWLDKNGSHNQMPAPGKEPSAIFHFRGKAARCNGFRGMGTDNKGNRLAFGSPSTDFSFMHGEYFSGREAHKGTFAHT
ncbi:MAG: hypothetical protein M0Z59_02955 [Nitrospiraceae bacterium]|nr:hypothetical protein [Nitrospiraceae bacterium]